MYLYLYKCKWLILNASCIYFLKLDCLSVNKLLSSLNSKLNSVYIFQMISSTKVKRALKFMLLIYTENFIIFAVCGVRFIKILVWSQLSKSTFFLIFTVYSLKTIFFIMGKSIDQQLKIIIFPKLTRFRFLFRVHKRIKSLGVL